MKRLIAVALVVSVPVYWLLVGDKPAAPEQSLERKTSEDWMAEIQQKLKADPNQSELWFQLAQGYLAQQQFKSALTCFDYAIRLSASPTANQLAGKATALYYLKSQRMAPDVQSLLQQALDKEPNNPTALMLLANDHFISFRYQQAIDIWIQLLDSGQRDLNRPQIIDLLNQAKQMQINE